MRWRLLIWLLLSSVVGVMVWRRSTHHEAAISSPVWSPGFSRKVPENAESLSNRQDTADINSATNAPSTARFKHRLTNTSRSLDDLARDPQAILLENALLDTASPTDLPLPANLRAAGDPGAYIVQCRGDCTDLFRLTLERAGAKVISYIPNNTYLVRGSKTLADTLAGDPQVAAVLAYQPYYKIKPSLLDVVLLTASSQGEQDSVAVSSSDEAVLNVLLFDDAAQDTLAELGKAGMTLLAQDLSPFGPYAKIRCSTGLISWIAGLPGVQELEFAHVRVPANDLSRARIGAAPDSISSNQYLLLSGSNVVVNVNDLGVDANHPDLTGRVSSDVPTSGVDANGHGTHVAGIIASSGGRSLTVTNAPGSMQPPVPGQFRGLAPAAQIFSIRVDGNSPVTDAYLQQTTAKSKAFISNNSWHYADDNEYDLGAASYDAAVRDALPAIPGSQPLLYVFAAGNRGSGADDGTGGLADTIQSPGTAKNVVTVGAIEQARFITNQTWSCSTNGAVISCQTNAPWLGLTDSSNEVARFSSRGNVGPGVEGVSGRFKPDLVAPGTFLISTRATAWDQTAYYSSTNNDPNLAPDPIAAEVLSNLNNGLGPFYRFESGTSLSAASVSGTLALMQEFFEQRLLRTNSPALMKALLINGARSLAGGYSLDPSSATNSQGWGVVQLPNSLPSHLTNPAAPSSSMWFIDQSPSEALSTAQQRTRLVSLAAPAQSLPLRVTLAWTDPPGNPVAGVKLVNNLDLIVTNLQTGEVFWGNDIPPGGVFNAPWQPGTRPNADFVNNVENVLLSPGLGSNYSVTVSARRVAVNAVSERPDGIVQDYVLVISSGDGQLTNALTVTDATSNSVSALPVTILTNSFGGSAPDFGTFLLHQRAGVNAALPGTNTFPAPGFSNAVISVGIPSQWHFYVLTNETSFTNAVFLTFLAQPLSIFPAAAGPPSSATSEQVWFGAVDLDLYVSRNPGLTNLDPVVLAAADTSLGRGGNELIIYSNAVPGAVYYVGVKCESLQGAEYGFLADLSGLPFAQDDAQGNELLRGFPEPAAVPGGSSSQPGQNYVFHVTSDSFPVRRVIVTNVPGAAAVGHVQVAVAHKSFTAVLNNYSTNSSALAPAFVYSDSSDGDIPGSLASSGPGTLSQFAGEDARGLWLVGLTSTNQPATNQASSIFLERQPDLVGVINATILPGACREDYVAVPMQATNLTATASIASGTGPISLQVYPCGTGASNCASLLVSTSSTGGAMVIDQTSQPPLNPGGYLVRTCNRGSDPLSVMIQASVVLSASAPLTNQYVSARPLSIPVDAVSASTILVTNTDRILSAEVGVRIDHTQVSDLVLSLVAPDGARVLLDAGRGGASTGGLGATLVVTNTTPIDFSGGPAGVTNIFDTGETFGTILINFDFFALPDEMRVYYETNLLYDSGLVSFRGSTNIQFGPGNSTSFRIVMNEGGNSESNTSWHYSVTTTALKPMFLTFTENTNLTVTPIKFAPPPFTNQTVAPSDGSAQNGIFYLPEQSLNQLVGKSAVGAWTLEIWDSRTGATSRAPRLVSWQLALVLADSMPTPISLVNAGPSTNLLGPGQIQWYEVDVPTWASFVTNSLLSSTAPINLLFNATVPPTGTNAGDLRFAVARTNGNWVLHTNASPGIIPGSRYYLGVENTNAVTVGVAMAIELDVGSVVTLSSGVPYSNTNPGPLGNSDFYRYVVSTNAERIQFEVDGPTSDVELVARKGAPLPSFSSYDFISAYPGTNDELIVVFDYSRPVSLAPGEWFLGVINVTGRPASYSIMATEFAEYGTNIVVSQPAPGNNSLCLTWSSLPGVRYHIEGKTDLVSPAWIDVSATITAADYSTTYCIPLPSPYEYFRVSEGLVPVPVLPIINSIVSSANGTLLQWTGPTNLLFSVQWTPALVPAAWRPVQDVVTSTNGTFLFFDDGSHTGGLDAQRFYRLHQMP